MPSLDQYFQGQVGQDARRRVATAFVLVEQATGRIAGYYTLSAANIDPRELPDDIAKKLPRYRALPATLLGRLAVDSRDRGKRLGGLLLDNALRRSLANTREIGSVAVVVDAIDGSAAAFYEHFGFKRFPGHERQLFMLTKTIEQLVDEGA